MPVSYLGAAIGLPQGTTGVFLHGSCYPGDHRLPGHHRCDPRWHSSPAWEGATCYRWGLSLLALVLTNVIAVAGWGELFPLVRASVYAGYTGSLTSGSPLLRRSGSVARGKASQDQWTLMHELSRTSSRTLREPDPTRVLEADENDLDGYIADLKRRGPKKRGRGGMIEDASPDETKIPPSHRSQAF